jgi:hypothetical protein
MSYRTKNRTFLLGIEAVEGVEEALTPAANAIQVEEPTPDMSGFESFQTNEAGGSLDNAPSIFAGGFMQMQVAPYFKGSGTVGVAPDWGAAARACAMAETLTAADVADTAQVGSTASTIVLAAAESATDNIFKGMVIDIDGGVGAGQGPRIVTAYNGTTKVADVLPDWTTTPDATSTYRIHANSLYIPASTALETATAFLYDNSSKAATNSLLRKIIGGAGDLSLEMNARQPGRMTVNLRGILPENPTNVAAPAAPTVDATRPRPLLNADVYFGRTAVKFNRLNLNLGGTVDQADDPGAVFGYDVAGVVERRVVGTINPKLGLLSERDNFADFRTGATREIWARWGDVAGNRVSVFVPACTFTSVQPSDVRGFNHEDIGFDCGGFDSGLYLSVY